MLAGGVRRKIKLVEIGVKPQINKLYGELNKKENGVARYENSNFIRIHI